jgi:glyoxylase-like metal-dependent hydrolase (beta-lactamase superfamily II)
MSVSKRLAALICLVVVAGAAWMGSRPTPAKEGQSWREVAPGVLRSPGPVAGYALVAGDHALLIDAPVTAEGLKAHGVKKIEAVLLTHHHRDTAAVAGKFLASGSPVRAPKASAPLLTPDGVSKYWRDSLPLRNSRTFYLVLPEGLAGIDCSLADGQEINWQGWSIRVVATPGHSQDHVAFAVRKGKAGPLLLFCGDALSAVGKMWSPYTTDWDHWTNIGLKPAAESLRKLAALSPAVLLPAHGEVIKKQAVAALTRTAEVVEEVSFLKSFERFTKERLKNPPKYRFLAPEQSATNGSKPWSQISPHLFLTGNTYVLVSKANTFLVVDPWDPRSAAQIPKLKADQRLGPMEVVLFSHAHYDHYDGIYSIVMRENPKVWTLDHVAVPLAEPFRYRAPFLDARPVKFDRRMKDGETAEWREYRLRFCYLPGQTDFTMGVETVIDGKKCFFTADNFFHHDQYSGTGGWMGLNRSSPLLYAASAEKVLKAQPDWVLGEHGSAMEFNAEDFRRRVQWGKAAGKAANDLSPSSNHRKDWNPHRVRVEPLVQKAKPGQTLRWSLIADNPLAEKEKLAVTLDGRGRFPSQTFELMLSGKKEVRKKFSLRLPEKMPPGRHIFTLSAISGGAVDGSDAFLGADVSP